MKADDIGVPAEQLIDVVKNSVKRGNTALWSDRSQVYVTSIDLELRVVATRTRGGGFSFHVPVVGGHLSLSAKTGRVRTETISLTLVPTLADAGHEVRGSEVEDALVEAICSVRRMLDAAAQGEQPWNLKTGSVELDFAVTATGGIVLGVDMEKADEATQSLRLTLGPAD